ncbi:MAG: hypothetical protein LBS19_12235, partial [Clostridiales bacterium]|nr:hypothetical protein [Clostridiales bacterium]
MFLMFLGKAAGLLRQILMAGRYATGNPASEAINYATLLPRTVLDVFFASAFTVGFIPVFSKYFAKEGKRAAFRLTDSFITLSLAATALITLILMFAAEPVFRLFITANNDAAFITETMSLGVPMLRIILPTIVLSAGAYCITGVLQAMDEFNVPAAMSLASNILIIIYLLFFEGTFGLTGLAVVFLLGWGAQL